MKIQIIEKEVKPPMGFRMMEPMKAYRVTEVPTKDYSTGKERKEPYDEAAIGDILICFDGKWANHAFLNLTKGSLISTTNRDHEYIKVVRAFEIKSITLFADAEDRPE